MQGEAVAAQDGLPPYDDPGQLARGLWPDTWPAGPDHCQRVVLCLEQVRYQRGSVDADSPGSDLQAEVLALADRQQVIGVGPPALAPPLPGAVRQVLLLGRVGNAVQVQQQGQVACPDRCSARLYPRQRARCYAQPAGDIVQPQSSFGPQPAQPPAQTASLTGGSPGSVRDP
jgi:hypothetical protein